MYKIATQCLTKFFFFLLKKSCTFIFIDFNVSLWVLRKVSPMLNMGHKHTGCCASPLALVEMGWNLYILVKPYKNYFKASLKRVCRVVRLPQTTSVQFIHSLKFDVVTELLFIAPVISMNHSLLSSLHNPFSKGRL